jgi:hypothetical protein
LHALRHVRGHARRAAGHLNKAGSFRRGGHHPHGDYPVIATIPDHKAIQAIGSVVFCVEGAMVDRRLCGSPASLHWRKLHDRAFSVGHGVPDHEYEEVTHIVASELPHLNEERLWASNTATRTP